MTATLINPIISTGANPPQKTVVVYADRPIKQMARDLFDDRSYKCFLALTHVESRLNPLAINPTSGAQGIGQLLPSTMKSLGLKETKSANVQLLGLIAYASRRHSSICSAWKYWQKNSHY